MKPRHNCKVKGCNADCRNCVRSIAAQNEKEKGVSHGN